MDGGLPIRARSFSHDIIHSERGCNVERQTICYPQWTQPLEDERVTIWMPTHRMFQVPRERDGKISMSRLRDQGIYTPNNLDVPKEPVIGTILKRSGYRGYNGLYVFNERRNWEIHSRTDDETGQHLADGELSSWESERVMIRTFNSLGD